MVDIRCSWADSRAIQPRSKPAPSPSTWYVSNGGGRCALDAWMAQVYRGTRLDLDTFRSVYVCERNVLHLSECLHCSLFEGA